MRIYIRIMGSVGAPLTHYEATVVPRNGDIIHWGQEPRILLVQGLDHYVRDGALESVYVFVVPVEDPPRAGQGALPLATPETKG